MQYLGNSFESDLIFGFLLISWGSVFPYSSVSNTINPSIHNKYPKYNRSEYRTSQPRTFTSMMSTLECFCFNLFMMYLFNLVGAWSFVSRIRITSISNYISFFMKHLLLLHPYPLPLYL